nr:laforin-like [Equus asinus]
MWLSAKVKEAAEAEEALTAAALAASAATAAARPWGCRPPPRLCVWRGSSAARLPVGTRLPAAGAAALAARRRGAGGGGRGPGAWAGLRGGGGEGPRPARAPRRGLRRSLGKLNLPPWPRPGGRGGEGGGRRAVTLRAGRGPRPEPAPAPPSPRARRPAAVSRAAGGGAALLLNPPAGGFSPFRARGGERGAGPGRAVCGRRCPRASAAPPSLCSGRRKRAARVTFLHCDLPVVGDEARSPRLLELVRGEPEDLVEEEPSPGRGDSSLAAAGVWLSFRKRGSWDNNENAVQLSVVNIFALCYRSETGKVLGQEKNPVCRCCCRVLVTALQLREAALRSGVGAGTRLDPEMPRLGVFRIARCRDPPRRPCTLAEGCLPTPHTFWASQVTQ